MIHPERNDVNIERLFNWGKKIEVVDSGNQELITCYIRLVGDSDMNKARVYALRKSAEMRRKLKAKDTDERLAYIADKEFLTNEEIVKYALLLENRKLIERAYKEVRVPFPKEPPSDASLEAQEKYQYDVDNYSKNVRETVDDFINKEIKKEEERLTKMSPSDVYSLYESRAIEEVCETEMLSEFRDYCVYQGSYEDELYTVKLFKSVEEFKDLPSDIKKQFEVEYNSLEIDIETLKKLQGATPL